MVALAVSLFQRLNVRKLWIELGARTNQRWIPVHENASKRLDNVHVTEKLHLHAFQFASYRVWLVFSAMCWIFTLCSVEYTGTDASSMAEYNLYK